MRIQAIDNEEQSEVVIERDETGYGFDETPPSPPLNLKEKHTKPVNGSKIHLRLLLHGMKHRTTSAGQEGHTYLLVLIP